MAKKSVRRMYPEQPLLTKGIVDNEYNIERNVEIRRDNKTFCQKCHHVITGYARKRYAHAVYAKGADRSTYVLWCNKCVQVYIDDINREAILKAINAQKQPYVGLTNYTVHMTPYMTYKYGDLSIKISRILMVKEHSNYTQASKGDIVRMCSMCHISITTGMKYRCRRAIVYATRKIKEEFIGSDFLCPGCTEELIQTEMKNRRACHG
jgi:hypothetical protein